MFIQVNASGQFCGIAEMTGRVDFNKSMDFWQQDKWNGYFPVKWHIIKDVPNPQLRHIILENNDHKPVTNSRDTQEVCILHFIVNQHNPLRKTWLFLLHAYSCHLCFSSFRWIFPKVLKFSTFSRTMWQELPYWMTLSFTKAARRSCRRRKQGNLCPIPVYRSALHCYLIPKFY